MKNQLFNYLSLTIFVGLFLTGCSHNRVSEQTVSLHHLLDIEYYQLDNGLRVVLNRDQTRPAVTVAVYYGIGFRNEAPGKTGFAHLFEHFMFQGSQNLAAGEYRRLVELNGGRQSASTRFDYTNYFQGVPKDALDKVLWAESDRMRSLKLNAKTMNNQISVVKTEVDTTVNNLPYGSFPWLDMPQLAFDNWYNAHNFYGDLRDLDSVTLDDARLFFDTYYVPNNAVLVIAGDFDSQIASKWIRDYFGDIPKRPLPAFPDFSEKPQQSERVFHKTEGRGFEHAFAFSYRMPERNSSDYYAMGLINQLMLQGSDSWLAKELVSNRSVTTSLDGGINFPLGNMFNYSGPMLWTGHLFYTGEERTEEIVIVLDELISRLQNQLISEDELAKIKTKLASEFYDNLEYMRFDLLASFALFDNDPHKINTVLAEFDAVTAQQLQKTARKYLAVNNRTRLSVAPGNGESRGE